MVQYRRNRIEGGSYFFTVTLKDRSAKYLTQYINELRQSFQECMVTMPFTINAIVILPEHLHCIWTLPEGDYDYSTRWRKIKTSFTQSLLRNNVEILKDRHGQYNLWQRRFWEHTIRDDNDFSAHLDYIHYNPVKHGYVSNVKDWQFSSFHRFVREGRLPLDWAGNRGADNLIDVGE